MKAIFAAALLGFSCNALAQNNSVVFIPTVVPTLDDLGIVGLIALVGALGGWLARRRK